MFTIFDQSASLGKRCLDEHIASADKRFVAILLGVNFSNGTDKEKQYIAQHYNWIKNNKKANSLQSLTIFLPSLIQL